jgi:hypothetical protein
MLDSNTKLNNDTPGTPPLDNLVTLGVLWDDKNNELDK